MRITVFVSLLALILGASAIAFGYLPRPPHAGSSSLTAPPDIDHLRATQLARSAHDLMDNKLGDYPSARFKDVRAIHYFLGARGSDVEENKQKRRTTELNSYALCGLVNSKNAFGAYTGLVPFAIYEGAVHIADGTDANQVYEVTSICTGRGDGAEMALRNINSSNAIITAMKKFPSFTDERVLTRMYQAGRDDQQRLEHNSFPLLPHNAKDTTDYSREIASSSRATSN